MLSSPCVVGGVGSASQLISVLGSHLCRCLRLLSLCHGACVLAGLILTRIPASAPRLLTAAFSHAPLPWVLFAPLIFQQLIFEGQEGAWQGGTLTNLHGPILAASAPRVPSIAAPGCFSLPRALVLKPYRASSSCPQPLHSSAVINPIFQHASLSSSSINPRKEAALIAARSSPWIHQLIVLSYLRGHESAQGRAVREPRLILKPWRQLRHSQKMFGFPNPFGKRWGRIPALHWGSWQVNVLHAAAIGSLRCNTNKFSIFLSAPGGRGMGADAVTARSVTPLLLKTV